MLEDRNFSNHFTIKELACPHCWKMGTLYLPLQKKIIIHLESFRSFLGERLQRDVPIIITSACRCEFQNKAVRGAKDSYHITGQAIDFYVPSLTLSETYRALEHGNFLSSFNGLGFYPDNNFLHLDIGSRYARWVCECKYPEYERKYTNLLIHKKK